MGRTNDPDKMRKSGIILAIFGAVIVVLNIFSLVMSNDYMVSDIILVVVGALLLVLGIYYAVSNKKTGA